LKRSVGDVVAWVTEKAGLTLPVDQISFDIYNNPRGRLSCQGKVGYRGPVSPTTGGWPKIKIDLTADEKLVLPAVRREVFHPYSDRPEEGLWANCYAYEEAFGEKIRALGERIRPRDLYDVVNLYRRGDSRPSASALRNILEQKCAYKAIALPTFDALEQHREDLESMWQNMLGHQLPMIPPVEDFWDALPEIFTWVMGGAEVPQRTRIEPGSNEVAFRSRALPANVSIRTRSALEIIRFAAANHLCVDLIYNGSTRRIEPYSLRQTAEGNFVLHAIRSGSVEHRSYRVDRIQVASVTGQPFSPRYLVELTHSGPLPASPPTSHLRILHSSGSGGPVYVYKCAVCKKTFERRSMNGSLNPHKHPKGYPCPGRNGVYVRKKF